METPTTNEAPAVAAERKRAEPSNFLAIVRGRLPLVFVHAIRFDATLNAMGNKDLAAKFATSVGKVFDIKKNRNFAYVDAGYVPSAEDLQVAQLHIDSVGAQNAKGITAAGDKGLMQATLDEYKGRGVATAEQTAALSAARGATRKPKEAKAPAAGGETQNLTSGDVGQTTAEALLS